VSEPRPNYLALAAEADAEAGKTRNPETVLIWRQIARNYRTVAASYDLVDATEKRNIQATLLMIGP
jgi:hypothetical protein